MLQLTRSKGKSDYLDAQLSQMKFIVITNYNLIEVLKKHFSGIN